MRFEQRALGVEHVQIIGQSASVPLHGYRIGALGRPDERFHRFDLGAVGVDGCQRILYLAKRLQVALLVIEHAFPVLFPCDLHAPFVGSELKDGAGQVSGYRP